MKKINIIVVLISLSIVLSGCLKPIGIKGGSQDLKSIKQQVLNIKRRDNGAIYQRGMRISLYEDTTARYVGDILTVILIENTNASSTSNTNSSKDNKVDLPGPTLAGQAVKKEGVEILSNKFSGEREFNGQGTSSMNSSFNGKISVTVTKVLPNNNLIVRGEKMMMLNQSDEFIRFVGLVRTQDIDQDNTIKSTRVASVHMAYGGQGDLSAANKMGHLGRFFQSKAWPY